MTSINFCCFQVVIVSCCYCYILLLIVVLNCYYFVASYCYIVINCCCCNKVSISTPEAKVKYPSLFTSIESSCQTSVCYASKLCSLQYSFFNKEVK